MGQRDVEGRNDVTEKRTRAVAHASLSALEWSAVAVARLDRLSTLQEPSRLAKALGSLFGRSDTTRLADARLEALRRAAVYAWHGVPKLPEKEGRAFWSSGYSPAHYDLLRSNAGSNPRIAS